MKETTPQKVPADAQIIDVREDWEWADGHAKGAHHIPKAEVPNRMEEIDLNRDVFVICQSGGRSGQVCEWLDGQGIEATNIVGGTKAWRAAGLPMD